jgi:hypothetical protein
MANSKYSINKGINKPIEFKGLKAQYIAYLAVGVVGLLMLFAILYLIGFSVYVVLPIVGVCGFVLFNYVYKYSKKYGVHGLMKEAAYRQLPESIKGRRLYKILQSQKKK